MRVALAIVLLIVSVILGTIGCAHIWGNPTDPPMGHYYYTERPVSPDPPKRVIHIWVDKNFPDYDQKSIAEAVDNWNIALNGRIKLQIVDTQFDMEVDKIVTQVKENGWLFMKIDSSNPIIPAEKEPGFVTIGFADRIGGTHMYLIRDRLNYWDVKGITMHEIGHLLGSDHTGKRLMFPHYTQARFQCVDWDTISQVAKYQGLDVDQLNFCLDRDDTESQIPVHDAGVESKTVVITCGPYSGH
jgi:hypothetical protein